MNQHIEAVFFDMGDTLRRYTKSDERKIPGVRRILELLGSDQDPGEFSQVLNARAQAYKQWARNTLIELNEKDLWTRWMLPDWPVDQVITHCSSLNQAWRDSYATREFYPETKEVILQLFRRGYHIGVVSNTTSSTEVPHALEQLGIAGCFESVVLSCVFGKRKPDPGMLVFAAGQAGIPPERCAYVGNKPDRDVVSARKAGYAVTIILRDKRRLLTGLEDPSLKPDYLIDNLRGLLDIFPRREGAAIHPLNLIGERSSREEPPAWNASLSTMWAIRNFQGLGDFLLAARRLGFAGIELNHQVNSKMLAGIEFPTGLVPSVHEPCPADTSTDVYRERDWLISSRDENNRQQGVESIKKSIDLAREVGARVVVIHCGSVRAEQDQEKESLLRSLFRSGQVRSEPYFEAKYRLKTLRAALVDPHLEAVEKSLRELLEYAGFSGIAIGLENRYHYMDIPSPDEMGIFLSMADPDRLGLVFDIGHAETLDRLVFYPKMEWLERFSYRMMGVHLHDVTGVSDHYAPGLGDVNFDEVIPYLPSGAFRTFELRTQNSFAQVRAGVKLLVDKGIITRL